MRKETKCKFCGKLIFITIDDDYLALGDPLKLMPFAACNRCADLRVKRWRIEEQIERFMAPIVQGGGRIDEGEVGHVKEVLTTFTKRYTALIAEWVGSTTPWWDAEIVDSITDNPKQYSKFLAQCWKMYEEKTE